MLMIHRCVCVCVRRYIPVLMQQAKIYWDLENYQQVEKIFRKSVEFCNEHDAWKLNVAHVLFMQENKFKEATGFYEPIVKKHYENVRMQCWLSLLQFRLSICCFDRTLHFSIFAIRPSLQMLPPSSPPHPLFLGFICVPLFLQTLIITQVFEMFLYVRNNFVFAFQSSLAISNGQLF